MGSAVSVSFDQQHGLHARVALLTSPVWIGKLRKREGSRERKREAFGLDQLSDFGERWLRATGIAAGEGRRCFRAPLESAIVMTCSAPPASSMRSGRARLPDEVEHEVDTLAGEPHGPARPPLAVGERLGLQRGKYS